MSILGTWLVDIATPIGTQHVEYEFTETGGIASARGDVSPLLDLVVDGDTATWRQSITKPIRLNLVFSVTVEGDELSGVSRAGSLPSSRVTGRRLVASDS